MVIWLAITLFVGFILGMLSSSIAKDKHEHKWEVLYRCWDCEEVKTETLHGHWTYEELNSSFGSNDFATEYRDNMQLLTQICIAIGAKISDDEGNKFDVGALTESIISNAKSGWRECERERAKRIEVKDGRDQGGTDSDTVAVGVNPDGTAGHGDN